MIANSIVSTNAIIFILSGDHFLLEEALHRWERVAQAESHVD
jgi:hypothetical protein